MSGERTFDYEKAFNHGPLGCGGGSCRSCRTCDYDCKGNRTGLGDEEGVDEEIFYLQWHLTALCTNRCAHCYHEDYGTGGLAEDQLFAIADHFDEALDAWGRTGKVALTGGEPLIIKETTLAVSERLLAGHTDRIDILTNGTLVTHEVLDQLGALGPGARHIQLSIDGTQQTHDAIRGEGDFARVMRAAELVKLAGFSLSFMFTLSDHNAADLIAVHKIVESFGATIGIDRYAPLGQATNRDISTVSSEVVRTAVQQVVEWRKERGDGLRGTYRPLFGMFTEDLGAMCGIGLGSLCVMHDGAVLPCRRLPVPLWNALDGFLDQWEANEFLSRMRDPSAVPACAECDKLRQCRGCRAQAWVTTGDAFGPDPDCQYPAA